MSDFGTSGIAWGDVDNDEAMDVIVISRGGPRLVHRNQGGGAFSVLAELEKTVWPFLFEAIAIALGDVIPPLEPPLLCTCAPL